MHRNFLVVAGEGKAREALARILRTKEYTVTLASSGSEALLVVKNVSVDDVIIETHLPDVKAPQLRSQILAIRPGCRVVTLTSFGAARNSNELLRFGGEDYLLPSGEILELLGRSFDAGSERANPVTERGKTALIEVVDVLVGLIELGEKFFGGCSHQVMRLARAIAEEMGVQQETLDEIIIATLLRDIGKVGLDPELAHAEGEFSSDQIEQMRSHVPGSLRILEHIDFPWQVLRVIRHHHERYDGRGYPDGLRGREIPIGARIVAVADAYIAMISDRPHRPAVGAGGAEEQLTRFAGTQFDPEVVEVFLTVIEKRERSRTARRKPLVLLVDPQEEFRNLAKMRLLNEGLDVEAVESVEAALEKLATELPDLILAGVCDERAEAFHLLHEIRESDSMRHMRHIPYAFLSDRDDRVLKVRALRQGVDDFLLKSIDLEDLVARVENILIRESSRRAGGVSRRRRGITGQIENLPLPDIIQMLAIGKKTACVTLSSGKGKGRIWLEEGSVQHAETPEVVGEQAFYDLVKWTSGEFLVEHNVKTKNASISQDAMFLLMESLRLIDEESQPDAETCGTVEPVATHGGSSRK